MRTKRYRALTLAALQVVFSEHDGTHGIIFKHFGTAFVTNLPQTSKALSTVFMVNKIVSTKPEKVLEEQATRTNVPYEGMTAHSESALAPYNEAPTRIS